VSSQIDNFNVLVYLYGNSAAWAFAPLLLFLLHFFNHNSLWGFDWLRVQRKEKELQRRS